jgi:hypothetical protein
MYGYLQYLYGGSSRGGGKPRPGLYLAQSVYNVNTASADVEYYMIADESGEFVRYPATGFYTSTESSLTPDAENIRNISDSPSNYGSIDVNVYDKDVTILYFATAPVLTIDQPDQAFSFLQNETVTGSVNMGNGLVIEPFSEEIVFDNQGPQDFTFQSQDFSGTPSNEVNRTYYYAPDLPVLAVDDNRNVRDGFSTEEYQVDVTYLAGGVVLTDEQGNPLYGDNGDLLYEWGDLVIEPAVPLVNGSNVLNIGPVTDDFGNELNVSPFTVVKIPKIDNNNPPTTASLEEYPDSLVPHTFLVDVGAPYESTEVVNLSFVGQSFDTSKTFGPLTADQAIPISRGGVTNYPAEFSVQWKETSVRLPDEIENFTLINGTGATIPVEEIENFTLINGAA